MKYIVVCLVMHDFCQMLPWGLFNGDELIFKKLPGMNNCVYKLLVKFNILSYYHLHIVYLIYDICKSANEAKHPTTMHFIGRVTMLFANNFLTECLITMKFSHIFF